ncbi:carbohydrate ABC transporter substrate-binding protein [Kribbella sandramycini]|uniref:Carbohydrate ABC transporter substrate-binding protein n=1 Tax=Kribbella sandramycini TaxID=60450 RepID=A0A7Y4KZL1_9ACTN|nr:ABC transporter substrate-binding protein [Kribbella sandramycini]MBB6565305.1 glucose/mannose transport system substrate-binding protein [Kribbella sandramycini]NOL41574.1 carbohydrate ABC transporter substrate-binding protein [Kribbella sandramycini]
MRAGLTKTFAVLGAAGLLAVSACGNSDDGGSGDTATKDVTVFTWWADGGEKAGLDGLVSVFKTDCKDYNFVNSAVAGGAGSNAKQVLANDLQAGKPPSTFQAHAGAELKDYINAGQVDDVSGLYKDFGLDKAFPQNLIDQLTVDGKIYSIPANVHRANVVWASPAVLQKAKIDATKAPANVDAWIADLQKLQAAGVKAPLAISKGFAQEMLVEAVLLGELGTDTFNGLWDGKTDWAGANVTAALNKYKTLLSFTNADRETIDWPDALGYVNKGQAGYTLMGDWVAAQQLADKVPDSAYTYWPSPGTAGTFQFLADSFTLPTNGQNPEGTKCWLKTVGSAEGQKAFNTKKGSIPARSDANPADYPKYQQVAMADWKSNKIAGSCAHGSSCSAGQNNDILSALSQFSGAQDVAKLQTALGAALKTS